MLRSRLRGPRAQRRPHRRASDNLTPGSPAESVELHELERRQEADLERARTAGGPLDRASYACACGFVFIAAVSTSVACPHCGARQAW